MSPTHSTTTYAALTGWLASGILLTLVLPRAQESPSQTGRQLTAPPGFDVERIAGPPLVNRPIVADFDEEGRLYVADSSGSNDKVEAQLADRPHRIVRLTDENGDGRFDTSSVFADRMMLPEGTMWFDGSLYVAAPPSIWKLTDTDGDGVADRREEWFKGETLTGCANDLHGPYLGPDGWIYWTKGAFARQTYERAGRPDLVTRAAHIFRRRPDSPSIEVVMTGGMDNPVDVAFTPGGERILTATFLEHPAEGRRDALVHAIYGGVYGKPHGVLDGHPRTGDLMPVMCQLGPAVPAGLTRYASRVFGDDYRDSFFAAMFNQRKVTRHVLEPRGATFATRDVDFLVSDDRDFHPTDVLEDADGSLLVIDTGPWYKLCCPSSQLAKPEVFGGIYRVRRTGAPQPNDPRGQKLAWRTMTPPELARRLDDPRPAVQSRVLHELWKTGPPAAPALANVLRQSGSGDARRNAVWALARIGGTPAREAVRVALGDRDESVRQAAAHAAGLWRDRDGLEPLLGFLKSDTPGNRRAAAEAVGRIGDARAVPQLIAEAATAGDRVLEHSLVYAAIEIGDPGALTTALADAAPPRAKRAALVALDQMGTGHLEAAAVIPLLGSAEPVLNDAAWWIASRHPEWATELVPYFRNRLTTGAASPSEDLHLRLAPFTVDGSIQALLADVVAAAPVDRKLVALRAMAAAALPSPGSPARLKALPVVWVPALSHALSDGDEEVVRQGLAVVRSVPAPAGGAAELRGSLLRLARAESRSIDVRLDALNAYVGGDGSVGGSATLRIEPDLFDLLRSSLDSARPPAVRRAAAGVLERAVLDRNQLLALANALESVGPLELPHVLRAFSHGTDEATGLAVIAALERSKGRAAIRADLLRQALAKYPESVGKAAESLLSLADVDSARQAAHLDALLSEVQGGDPRRGQVVFNGPKAACLSCHAIGYLGGRIGPDLTRIGQIRSDRDLLEAVVYPNASFARGYEPVIVRTRSGIEHTGVLRGDALDEIVLSHVTGPDTRVPRADVLDVEPGVLSLMPSGYADMLTRQELADLLAFLRAAR